MKNKHDVTETSCLALYESLRLICSVAAEALSRIAILPPPGACGHSSALGTALDNRLAVELFT
jgi:hypothetical protein